MLLHNSAGNNDDWRLWLTAAGLPSDLSRQPGITFDLVYMTVQAAIDGMGVAMGRTSYVEADIAKGRLVVPFDITLPADAGFYLVSPEAKADTPKLSAFRHWLKASIHAKAEEPVKVAELVKVEEPGKPDQRPAPKPARRRRV